jgi:hypothetical protein
MSRNRVIVCGIVLGVFAIIFNSGSKLAAQGLTQSNSYGSTPFLAVPANAGAVAGPGTGYSARNNLAGNNYPANYVGAGYPDSSAQAAYNGTYPATATGAAAMAGQQPVTPNPTPGIAQGDINLGGSYYRSIPPSSLPLEPEKSIYFEEAWSWQFLPDGLLYQAYLAGGRESRLASEWVNVKDEGWMWDATLGGHVGVLRYGTLNSPWAEGWQLDAEGAAFVRMNMEEDRDLDAVDFRVGFPLTMRRGPWQGKFGYYHLSSHLGDEYMVRNQTFDRINYVRDCLVLGVGFFLNPDLRLYSEAGYGVNTDGGSEPWEFQFGVDYSPAEPTCRCPAPFFAVNGRIRQEVDYGGNFTLQTGVQWRGQSGHLARFGLQYFNGMSDFYEFFREHEEQIGMGLWYDY